MTTASPEVQAALDTLRGRLGGAAPRWGGDFRSAEIRGEVQGALAIAPRIDEETEAPSFRPSAAPDERVVSTGFRALDSILGLGGFPRTATVALQGDGTSGKTTLALQAVAQAQEAGGIAAYLDLARSLDPVEAVSRGVRLEWLVVLTPESLEEALAMAAMLLQDKAVDLLLLDLPVLPAQAAKGQPTAAQLGDRIHRLAAIARRAEVQLIVLEPPGLPSSIAAAVEEAAGLQLELSRQAWIRLGRDVVGQLTRARVTRNRNAPPGRAVDLRILYADGGPRDACLARDELLRETVSRPAEPADRAGGPNGAPPGSRGPGVKPVRPAPPFETGRLASNAAGPPRRSTAARAAPPSGKPTVFRCDFFIFTGHIF